jgi:hypothetical protein
VPDKYQRPIRQAIFFVLSTAAGCYMIYVTNYKGYMANMKRAPPLACLWLWTVIEMDLMLGVASLAIVGGFFYQGGYTLQFPS